MANRKRQPGNRPKFGMFATMATIARLGFLLPKNQTEKKPF
jgi:hypothetical protein